MANIIAHQTRVVYLDFHNSSTTESYLDWSEMSLWPWTTLRDCATNHTRAICRLNTPANWDSATWPASSKVCHRRRAVFVKVVGGLILGELCSTSGRLDSGGLGTCSRFTCQTSDCSRWRVVECRVQLWQWL